ncbi:MAG: hypothetical protein Q8L49_07825 [Burkholderiaceae bacterium]|nr:hypothetical protein [Burkholderiaceae bacterium]
MQQRGQRRQQRHQRGGGHGHRQPVPRHEARHQVAGARRAGADRAPGLPGAQVGGQGVDAGMALVGHLGQGLEHDAVEVTAQRAHQRVADGQHAAGARRRLVQHGLQHLARAVGRVSARAAAGEQLEQQQAQRVHVGGHAQRFAAHLLGAGVVGRERAFAGLGERRVGVFQRVQRLGDAEVQQLDLALGRDQHVGRLQVAVHQQGAVRNGDGVGQLQKQGQALGQRPPGAGLGQGLAVHALHHEAGNASGAALGVDQPRDVRMLQPRQRALLAGKAVT